MISRDMLHEYAPENSAGYFTVYTGPSRDETIRQILQSESASNRPHATLYDLFDEMEDKDGHLFSVLQTRKIGVLSRERRIIPSSESPDDVELARFVENALDRPVVGEREAVEIVFDDGSLGNG